MDGEQVIYVNVYVGQTRASGWINRLEALGFGECCNRGELPPRRLPWFFDNGAYKDFKAARAFDADHYQRELDYLWLHAPVRPDFMVVPDIVAGGMESLAFSRSWLKKLIPLKTPLYLAVQDGMSEAAVDAELAPYAGVFVGGSTGWKLNTGAAWVDFAHQRKRPCHIGRVGSMKRAMWARGCGADSIDSCLPLWGERKLRVFLEGLQRETNMEMRLP
jgi:hypothetical protein